MNNSLYTSKLTRSHRVRNVIYSLTLFGSGALFGGFLSIFIFLQMTGGSAMPSQPISAPTLSLETFANSLDVGLAVTDSSLTTPSPSDATASQVEDSQTNEPLAQVSSDPPAATQIAPPQPQLFRIVSQESEARFSVYETFPRGTAVGRTNQIAGDIIVDFDDPSNSQVGPIRINLRTLQTDDPDRDRSVRCCVLLTARQDFEFGEFVPVEIRNLPEIIEIGQTVSFQIVGNLTVRGTTRQEIFRVDVDIVTEDEIHGFATATVNRSDFGILNNEENGFDYHGVAENIILEFDFVARSVPE